MKGLLSIIPLAGLLLMAGCCSVPRPREPYRGSTQSMAQVVADINANNEKIPTLWAHHFYEADLVDDQNHPHHLAGDGVLLYQSPTNLRLIASVAAVGNVFEIGSNSQSFWMKLFPQTGSTLWWGNYADLAQAEPEKTGIPIRPDMVLDVLGVATINSDFTAMPAPIMRFDAQADAYVFIWAARLTSRWVALREVWYDRASKRPFKVLLYDLNGRAVLQADLDLKQYRQLPVEGLPKERWPWMPGDYRLGFADGRSTLHFTLDEAEITRREGGRSIPNPRSFRMPDPRNAGVDRVIQISPGPTTMAQTRDKAKTNL